jgi:hypothetical protein
MQKLGAKKFIRTQVLMFNVAVDFRLERRGRGVPTPAQLAGMVGAVLSSWQLHAGFCGGA